MTITVLGSGTSYGVPSINCNCPVCTSDAAEDKRTRASVWVKSENSSVIIDTSTDFRLQALREKIDRIDAIFITHSHADHIHGMDDIRPYSFKNPIPVYGNGETIEELRQRFAYIFRKTQKGGGKPKIELNRLGKADDTVDINGLEFTPIPLKHGELNVTGYRIGNFAYLTDCNRITDEGMRKLEGIEYLIIDALRFRPHPTHFTIDEAMETAKRIGAKQTWFTHLCHDVMHKQLKQKLPSGFAPAFDGLKIVI